jgi:hypothetical protein
MEKAHGTAVLQPAKFEVGANVRLGFGVPPLDGLHLIRVIRGQKNLCKTRRIWSSACLVRVDSPATP